jgi:hypothetical protein
MLAFGMRNADVVVSAGHKSPSYFQLNQAKILGCSHHHRLFVILIDLKVVAGGNSGLPVRRQPATCQQKKTLSRMRALTSSSLFLAPSIFAYNLRHDDGDDDAFDFYYSHGYLDTLLPPSGREGHRTMSPPPHSR